MGKIIDGFLILYIGGILATKFLIPMSEENMPVFFTKIMRILFEPSPITWIVWFVGALLYLVKKLSP